MKSLRAWVLGLLFFSIIQASHASGPLDEVHQNVLAQLQEAINAQAKTLGTLEPWQRTIFQDEVIPYANRFVKDYRPTPKGLQVEIDFDSIRKYFNFSASKVLKRQDLSLLTYLRVDQNCEKCVQASGSIGNMMKGWADRRGFSVRKMNMEDLNDPDLKGKALNNKLSEIAKIRDNVGALIMEVEQEVQDEVDSVHADEKKFKIRVFMNIRLGSDTGSEVMRELKHDGELELIETHSFEMAASKLLIETFMDFGGKAAGAAGLSGSEDDLMLEVSGFKDFTQYNKMKDQIQRVLRDATPLQEKRMSRGKVLLGFRLKKNIQQVKAMLLGVPVEAGTVGAAGRLSFEGMTDRMLRLEIR
jgi:hypothetical protein